MNAYGTAKLLLSTAALAAWLLLLPGAGAGVFLTGLATAAAFFGLGLFKPRLTLGLLVAFAATTHLSASLAGVGWFSPAEGGLLALWLAVSWKDRTSPARPKDLAGLLCLLFALYALLAAGALIVRFRYPSLATGLAFLAHPWADLLRIPMGTPLYGFRSAALLLEGMLAFALARRVDSEPGEGKATLWGLWGGGCVAVLSYFVFYLPRLFEPAKNWMTYRPALTLHDANSAASFGLLVLGAGIALASRGVKGKWVYLAPGLAVLFLGGSRVAFVIALLGCAGVTGLLLWVRAKARGEGQGAAALPSLGPALFATVVLAAMVALFVAKQERFQDLFSGDAYTTKHFAGRQGFLEAGLRMAADYPLSGVGAGTYTSTVQQYLDASIPVHAKIENAHSYPLQLAVEYGVPALLLWLLVLWAVLGRRLRHWRELSPEAAGLLAGVLFYLLHSLQSHPLLLPEHQILFWCALGGLAGHFNRLAETVHPSPLRWLAPLLLLAPLWSLTQAAPGAAGAQSFGLHPAETRPGGETVAWTKTRAWLVLQPGAAAEFRLSVQRPNLAQTPMALTLEADGTTLFERSFSQPTLLRAAFVPPAGGGGAVLQLTATPAFVPNALGLSNDRRELGVVLQGRVRDEAAGAQSAPPGGSWSETPSGLQYAVAPVEAVLLPPEARRASCTLGPPPGKVGQRATFHLPVTLRNESPVAWPGDELAATQKPLCAAYHWKRADGTVEVWDGARTVIRAAVPPGGTWEGELNLVAPNDPGVYLLEVDLLQEGVAWFGGCGGSMTVEVGPN